MPSLPCHNVLPLRALVLELSYLLDAVTKLQHTDAVLLDVIPFDRGTPSSSSGQEFTFL